MYIYIYRGGGFALTGYVVPGCVEDGGWMLWGNSSVAAALLARSFLDTFANNIVVFSCFHENGVGGHCFMKVFFVQTYYLAEGSIPHRLMILFLRPFTHILQHHHILSTGIARLDTYKTYTHETCFYTFHATVCLDTFI